MEISLSTMSRVNGYSQVINNSLCLHFLNLLYFQLSLQQTNTMKKILFMLALASAVSSAAVAQSLKFGIKGGADINKIKGKAFTNEFSYGYQLGVFSEIGITSKFGIQPEVIFSQVNLDTASGFKDIIGFENVKSAKLSYVKIPLLFSYAPNSVVRLQAGPQYGLLVDKQKTIGENGKSIFQDGDLSLVAGMQLNISKIRLYGRYAIGLNNINETGSPDKWKSQSVQVGLGLTL